MRSDRGAVGNLLAVVLGGAVGAGLLVGVVLGLTGAASLVDEPATLADAAVASYYDCPDGDTLGTVTRGDRVFITGRDASGDWAEIRSPNSPNTRVWMRARQVLPDGDTSDLPVFSCNVPVEAIVVAATTSTTEAPPTTDTTAAPPTTETTATTEAPPVTDTTSPAPPPPADTTAPSIGQQQASPGTIWEQDGGVFNITCSPPEVRQSTVSAVVTDAGGVAAVTANWNDPFGDHSVAMSASGSTYSTTIGPYPADTWPIDPLNHTVSVTILAVDGSGNQSTSLVGFAIWSIGECFV